MALTLQQQQQSEWRPLKDLVSFNEGGSISFWPVNLRYLDNFTSLSPPLTPHTFSKTLALQSDQLTSRVQKICIF